MGWEWGASLMGKMRKITLGIIMLVGVSPVSKAETAKEIKANQYTKCASSFVTTGAIKAAFNHWSFTIRGTAGRQQGFCQSLYATS